MKTENLHETFAVLFANPPARCRGLDVVHFFRNRRSFQDIWHHQPADPSRTLRNLEGKGADSISYGPHPELDPDRGIRGDLRCILGVIPRINSTEDLDDLVRGGIGGLAGNVAWSPEYPYDATDWADFREALDYCKQRNLEVWFYDEAGYPSGHANQRTLEGHPEYLAQGLQWVQQSRQGPGDCEFSIPNGTLYTVVAVAEDDAQLDGRRQVVIPARMSADRVEITLPAGRWLVFAFAAGPVWQSTHAEFLNIRYPNMLDGSAVRRFLDLTHEVYYREVREWFGETITGVFTDEPSLMSAILPSMADGQFYPNIPWVYDLPEIFQSRTGYSLAEALPALVADVGAPTVQRRCDFWGTISHLLSTRCYRQIGDWCTSHGIAYTGHLLWEEAIQHHVILHGDIMENLRWFGWPGYDALRAVTREEDPFSFATRTLGAKYVTSVAHLYGKPHTMCETFGVTDPHPLEIYEHVLDVLVLLGLERHGYYSILDKLTIEERAQLNTHLGRVSQAGFYGRHRCEVAMLYPIVAAWAGYNVSRLAADQDIATLDEALLTLSQEILDRQMDFDFCDDASLQQGTPHEGRWQMGEESYRVLVVPPMATMRQATLQALDHARCAGVGVVFADRFPTATLEEGPDESLAAWCGLRFGQPVPMALAINTVSQMTTEHPTLTPESSTIWITQRQRAGREGEWTDIFLIVNTTTTPYSGQMTLPAVGVPYWCDVQTGAISPVHPGSQPNEDRVTISLVIEGHGVRIIAAKR